MLLNIEQMLSYLPDQQRQDIMLLIKEYPSLFADIEESAPIRQHPIKIMKEEVKYLLDQGACCSQLQPMELTLYSCT